MDKEEADLRLKLSLVNGIGSRTVMQIIQKFGSIGTFFQNRDRGSILTNVNKSVIQELERLCDGIDINSFKASLRSKGIEYLVFGDADYPFLLTKIHTPPIVLYYIGDLSLVNRPNLLAVVGTRRCSTYGQNATVRFVKEFVNKGFVIVSGMAMGIDTLAHKTALASQGKTVAVLGSSVDEPSPKINQDLYKEIISKGLIVSEYSPSSDVLPSNFAFRNRIVAGLSRGVVVMEASVKSGALITAQYAFDENRAVFALPADITRKGFEGTNNLIKLNKSQLITDPEDVFIEFGIKNEGSCRKNVLNQLKGREYKLAQYLLAEALSEEQLLKLFDINVSDLLASLSVLELKGVVTKNEEGKYYVCQ